MAICLVENIVNQLTSNSQAEEGISYQKSYVLIKEKTIARQKAVWQGVMFCLF